MTENEKSLTGVNPAAEVPDLTAEEENPQPANPEPEVAPIYGKVIWNKGDQMSAEELAEADIVIEDKMAPLITKSRNGLTGVAASPELLELAEVRE